MHIADTYPVFEADQVLTNDHLNSLLNYLDQQDRLTRMKLIGSGIVCGLELTPTNESINVSRGCAVTSQGYLVCVPSSEFTHYTLYTAPERPGAIQFILQDGDELPGDIPFYGPNYGKVHRLITKKESEELTAEVFKIKDAGAVFLDTHAIVLFFEAEEIDLKNCDTNDCNDKGKQMHFEIRFLLVEKSVLDNILKSTGSEGMNASPDAMPVLKKFNTPVQALNSASDVILAFRDLVDDQAIKDIANAFKKAATQYHYLLKNENKTVFDSLFDHLKGVRDNILKLHPILIQYFYDHLDDLVRAYYEFIRCARKLNSECCMNEMRFPLHVMLGEADTATTSISQYRQYFIYSPLFGEQNLGLNGLQSLFARLRLLVSNFSVEQMLEFERKEIKITPSKHGSSPLGDRCIPYYYTVTAAPDPLYRSWSAVKTRHGEAELNLGYNSPAYNAPSFVRDPLLYDTEEFNFFRVEGHIGKHISSCLPALKGIQQANAVPVDIIALSADYIGALIKGKDPKCVIEDLESDYRLVIALFICRLHDVFCKVGRVEYNPQVAGIPAATMAMVAPASFSATGAASTAAMTASASAIAAEEAEESKILATGLLNAEIADHTSLPQLVAEFHNTRLYQKGDTLARLCKPGKNTIGANYISMMSKNPLFKNPVFGTKTILGSFLRNGFFELIDSVENMFALLMNNELSDLDLPAFKLAYGRFETMVNNLSDKLVRLNINKVIFLNTCIYEQLEALKTEYKRRLALHKMAENLRYYSQMHPGLEHKAGVTKGGTLVLVYHEIRKRQLFDINSILVNRDLGNALLKQFPGLLHAKPDEESERKTKELGTALQFKEPELYLRMNEVLTQYIRDCNDMPKPKKDALTEIISKPPQKQIFKLEDGMVIADFFLPYICCSDCPPIAYILPTTPTTPTIKIPNTRFCGNDKGPYEIGLQPRGGILKQGTTVLEADETGSYFIIPSANQPGEYKLTYSVDGNTVTAKYEVVKMPQLEFKVRLPQDEYQGTTVVDVEMKSTATVDALYTFDFGDGVITPQKEKKITHEYPQLSANEESKTYTIKVSVKDGPCTASIEKGIRFKKLIIL
jgi:hypothetical protein